MPSSRLPKVADCIRQLADKRRTPDAHAHRSNETVLNLVRAYARHFAFVCGQVKKYESVDDSLERCRHAFNENNRQGMAIRCLQDLNATAALVKELANTDVAVNDDASCHTVDLGAGTGVLSVGAAIAGIRSGAKQVILHVVDCESALLQKTTQALQSIGNHVQIISHDADIIEPDIYQKIDSSYVRFWISETISSGTPPVKIFRDRMIWPERGTYRHDVDPFPAVTNHLARYVPDFVECVQKGYTKFFPDCINGEYQPGAMNVLRLHSSHSHRTHGPLKTVGQDFHRLNPENEYFRWAY